MSFLGESGAKTIPARPARGAGFLAAIAAGVGLVAAGLLAACGAPRENSMHAQARSRELGARYGEQQELQRLRHQLELALAADREAVVRLRGQAALAAQERRRAERALELEVAAAAATNDELEAARAAAVALQQELEPLKKLRAEVELKELEHKALQQRAAALQPQLDAARKEQGELESRLQPQITALQEKIQTLQGADAAVQAALQAIAAAAGALSPPPEAPKEAPKK